MTPFCELLCGAVIGASLATIIIWQLLLYGINEGRLAFKDRGGTWYPYSPYKKRNSDEN